MSNMTWAFLSGNSLMPGDENARLDSPIERAFYRCFHYLCSGMPADYRIEIQTQVAIDDYRVDFLLLSLDGRRLAVVECDGHDFHERTKEQAARDKSRDRTLLLGANLPVMRFTGSEIYRDPFECAGVALAYAMEQVRP